MDYEERAADLEKQGDDMEEKASELGKRIESTKSDWRGKQSDPSVPGAAEEGDAGDRVDEHEGEKPSSEDDSST